MGPCYRKLKIRISEYPIIRYSDFCEIVYSSRTLLSEAHIGAADNRVYIRARTNIDEYRCTRALCLCTNAAKKRDYFRIAPPLYCTVALGPMGPGTWDIVEFITKPRVRVFFPRFSFISLISFLDSTVRSKDFRFLRNVPTQKKGKK